MKFGNLRAYTYFAGESAEALQEVPADVRSGADLDVQIGTVRAHAAALQEVPAGGHLLQGDAVRQQAPRVQARALQEAETRASHCYTRSRLLWSLYVLLAKSDLVRVVFEDTATCVFPSTLAKAPIHGARDIIFTEIRQFASATAQSLYPDTEISLYFIQLHGTTSKGPMPKRPTLKNSTSKGHNIEIA